jgi:hypothetical protein
MTYSIALRAFLVLSFGFLQVNSNTQNLRYKIIWEDHFSTSEKQKIEQWLDEVSMATAKTLGHYPFKVNYYLHRRSSSEPVPWAHTERGSVQGVHFYVDPSFSLKSFQMDWTASHEISHLSIPFVGRSNMWFSEGYASFMQWQVLKVQGLYTQQEIQEKYNAKMDKVNRSYDSDDNFMDLLNKMKRQYNFPALYWGGACYFFCVDAELQERGSSLMEVIQRYQKQNRNSDESLEELLDSLDELVEGRLFTKTYASFQKMSGKEVIEMTQTETGM